MYCPGWRAKTSAMRSNIRFCLRSISSLSRFLLVKAISIPEKKADSSNMTTISMSDCTIAFHFSV